MGWTSTGGPKGLGSATSTPSTVADFDKMIELIAQQGNYRGPVTEAERDALTGDALYEGLLAYNTTTDALELCDGSGWSPVYRKRVAYTPTLTGITVGSGGSTSAHYAIAGGYLRIDLAITFGSGLAITDPNVSLPSGFSHLGLSALVGDLYLLDVSSGAAGRYRGALQEGTSGFLRFVRTNAANGQMAPMSDASTPFTWVSGDQIVGSAVIPIV